VAVIQYADHNGYLKIKGLPPDLQSVYRSIGWVINTDSRS